MLTFLSRIPETFKSHSPINLGIQAMKRKSTEQVTTEVPVAPPSFLKNLRSKLPRRRRTHISPIIVNISSSEPECSLNSTCDEVSCNTTLESAVLPKNAVFHADERELTSKVLKKAAIEVSVSDNSCVESCSVVVASEVESKLQQSKQDCNGFTSSEFSSAVQNSPSTVTVEQSVVKDLGDFGVLCTDLACSEEFDCEVSSAEDILFGDVCSEFDDSTDEYTPSIWLNSGSQFSEKSFNDDSTPSPCFVLFKELFNQFSKLRSVNLNSEVSSTLNDEYSDELAFWRFEDEEDEESYRCLRRRERNQAVKVTDYADEYDFSTEYGGLIVEQRLLMVNWIIEISRTKDLHNETMFLGVCLLDRFLNKGFFASRRNLQLLGISCLTLAIRIEENQPYNSVRQKAFYVGSNTYSRTEVVAMEWVVQEVLKFQCLSPTIYNFLWFYLKAAEANDQMREKANYLASLALLDHRKLQFWPSTVAASVVILLSMSANRAESSQRVMQTHLRTKIDDLPECVKTLEWLMKFAG